MSDSSVSVTDYERHAMALMTLGINPYNGTSVNYIQKIVDSFDGNQIGDPSLINDDVFAIFPLVKSGYSSIPHSLGHGIGIEVHERPHVSPRSSEILEKGMVFSIEPGIYLPAGRHGIEDFGGVRIEDLFYFDGKSLVELTHSKKELIELK